MENTWASGAIELLKHADSHIQLDSAFDKRIAFISIDNSVETSIRTFISLPSKYTGINFSKKELDDLGNSFPKMVTLLFKYTSHKLIGLDEVDIEHYHRIRNQLYHNGTGLSVDSRYLLAYRQIAAILLNNLFGVKVSKAVAEPTLENLILLWNEIEQIIKHKFEKSSIPSAHTYKWEMAMKSGILTRDQIQKLTELRIIRNTQVHSTSDSIDKKSIAYAVKLAEDLRSSLTG
jgi:hypothetical protein